MIGYSDINLIEIPNRLIYEANDFLKEAGVEGVEGIALFAGNRNGLKFTIKKVIIPKQKGYILESGLMYAIDGDEIYRINRWLSQNKLKLFGQIHSHPREAYHSELDDRYPLVDKAGCISIVVPDFGNGPVILENWAIYQLTNSYKWERLAPSEISLFFNII